MVYFYLLRLILSLLVDDFLAMGPENIAQTKCRVLVTLNNFMMFSMNVRQKSFNILRSSTPHKSQKIHNAKFSTSLIIKPHLYSKIQSKTFQPQNSTLSDRNEMMWRVWVLKKCCYPYQYLNYFFLRTLYLFIVWKLLVKLFCS